MFATGGKSRGDQSIYRARHCLGRSVCELHTRGSEMIFGSCQRAAHICMRMFAAGATQATQKEKSAKEHAIEREKGRKQLAATPKAYYVIFSLFFTCFALSRRDSIFGYSAHNPHEICIT